jgi:basic membrane protein A and related proteins
MQAGRQAWRAAVLFLTAVLAVAAAVRGPGVAARPEAGRKRVAVVLSIGGLGDRSFNDMAFKGLMDAREELDVIGVYGEPAAMSEDERYLEFYAEQGFDLVFAIGFLMKDSLAKVAARHPQTHFAIIDDVLDAENVASVVFREHEGSYLVGALAARKSRTGKAGIVKGLDVPLLEKFEHGYRRGFLDERARLGLVGGEVFAMVAGSFADPVRGKELTRVLVEQGVDVVFQAAGQTGNGVISGAADAGIFAIGCDANQNHERPGTMLTSMVKRVDVAVLETIRDLVEGRFEAGAHSLGVAEGGVGWAIDEYNRPLLDADDEATMADLVRRITDGELIVEERP